MNKHYSDRAVVLRTMPLGEADRIVTLMTEAHGRVRAVAKGIRRTTSKFGSRLEPTTNVSLQLYLGRELDTITQAETVTHFNSIRDDLHRFGRANVMMETVDQVSPEKEPNPALYRMLVGALTALDEDDAPLVLAGFLLKLLSLEGFHPQLDVCVACGENSNLVAFDVDDGGLRCINDRRGLAIDPESIFLMRRMLGGDLGGALKEPESSATAEAEAVAVGLVEHHIERRLRGREDTPVNKTEVWEHVAAERVALADLLDAISNDAWERPSLCGGWRVHDVVAHLVALAEAKPGFGTMAKYVRLDPRPNVAIDKQARALAAAVSPGELTQRLRAARDGRFVVPGLPPVVALGEVLAHRADLAEAAGLPRRPADNATREVLTAELRYWFVFGVSPAIRRRRFVPTDADWSVGPAGGAVIEAPGEQLLLIATGRIASKD